MRDRAAGVALGAVAAALVAQIVDPRLDIPGLDVPRVAAVAALLAAVALVGGAALVIGQGLHRPGPAPSPLLAPARAVRRVLPVLVGAVLVAARVSFGGIASAPDDAVTRGEGTWHAAVESIGTPRGGRQPAVLRLEMPGAPRVAADLPRFPAVEPGDDVRVSGEVEPPAAGTFGDYLRRTRLDGSLRVAELEVEGRVDGAAAGLEGVRRTGGEALSHVLPEPEAGLAAGILIGLRDRVDRGVSAAFTTAGVTHVVAISGWNIAIVAAAIAALTGRWRRRTRAIVTLGAIACYTLLAGASPSVVRAAAMAGVVSLAREGGRGIRASSALAWAAVLLLLVDPHTVVDPGFQLSALATAGLIAWATPLTAWLRRPRGRRGAMLPKLLAESLGVSLAAQAATLPLVLVLFGRLSLVAPAVNLAIVPLVPASMAAGLIALTAGATALAGLPDPLPTLVAVPAWLLLGAMIRIAEVAASLPLASVTLEPPASYAVAGALIGMGALVLARHPIARGLALLGRWSPGPTGPRASGTPDAPWSSDRIGRRGRDGRAGSGALGPLRTAAERLRRPLLVVAGAALVVSLLAAARPDGRTHLTVLDVGQGDAILVESPQGGRLLVDGGPDPDRLLRLLDGRLPPWDHRLDLVVLTHPHEDHVGGLPLVLARYRVGRVFEPGIPGEGPGYAAFVAALGRRGLVPERLRTGDRLRLDEVRLRVLWPDPAAVPTATPDTGRGVNDTSIVLLADVEGSRVLLTADAEDDVDPVLVGRGLPHVAVLKVAHHGSRTATSETLLDATTPSVALVSVGAGNTYGHPSRPTLDRLRAHGAEVHRTDLEGSLEVTFQGDSLVVRPERGAGRAAALLYHPDDVGPWPGRGRLAAALPRPAHVVPASFACRRGDRSLARPPRRQGRRRRRSAAGRGRSPPPRCRQAAPAGRSGRAVAARRGIRGMARRSRAPRARSGRERPRRHAAARRRVVRALAAGRPARGADRRVCGQARRTATRVARGPLPILVAPLPARPG